MANPYLERWIGVRQQNNKLAEGSLRLVAAVHLRGTNDCCYRKQSFPKDFREGPLYPLKLPVESDHCQVTALACADLVLSTEAVWKHKNFIRISANGSTDFLYFGLLKIFFVKNDLSAPN